MFEEAGVARTERSITNWCQPNKMGMARLDSYFDPNERRYFITPESVRLSIEEEKAKAAKGGELHSARPPAQETPIPEESSGRDRESSSFGKAPKDSEEVSELRKEIMDLRIANRGKDMFIEHLTKERTEFVDQLMERSRKVGELETRLLQLDAPDNSAGRNADSA